MTETLNDLSSELLNLLEQGAIGELENALENAPQQDLRREISRLNQEDRSKLFECISRESGAGVLAQLSEAQATEFLSEIDAGIAADLIEALPSDIGSYLLRGMREHESSGILAEIEDTEESDDLRERISYPWDSAGGLMSDRVVAFRASSTVGEVLTELSENAAEYTDREVQYVYVNDDAGRLTGVLPLRDLVLTRRSVAVSDIMVVDPMCVRISATAGEIEDLFEERKFLGLPVVDDDHVLQGVVSREAVQEALTDQSTQDYLSASGIVAGEELRSMPMTLRSRRRLAWLGPNILLNILAAGVIAHYEDTLESVIALAVFLPIVSDMSGCSGNQAVAVSMRELTMEIIQPRDYLRVVWKEGIVGMMNGTILGIVLGSVAVLWKGNIYLGLVVGGALAINTILSVLIGGLVPLGLKRLKVDPALASGPILTTCTDMFGFFLVLSFASMLMSRLA
ncbi:MAG: magnesium transporter [Verrucomicrobiota bacterium JB025]|nr:magnesium transporter [Verrucomicrobiota bacterium JB025]